MAAPAFGNVHFLGVGRLDGNESVVVASHSYNTETDLDGVKQVLEQPSLGMNAGTHYNFQAAGMAWHLLADNRGRIYILISKLEYPQRCAHACLEELERTFVAKAGDRALTARHRELDRNCGQLFLKICQKYDNVAEIDKLAAVTQKVDSVKLVMQENIDLALQNTVRLEHIEKQAEELQQQAGVFKRNAHELQRKMWWKNLKMKLIIAFAIICILTVIIVPIVIWAKKK